MPIGSSKAGVLGAGVVPGGSETFNSSGTFSVPVGVTCVSVTGLGGTGNAGNAGQPGGAGGGGVRGRVHEGAFCERFSPTLWFQHVIASPFQLTDE